MFSNQLSNLHSECHGFKGNLWHNFIAFILVNNERSPAVGCEIRGGMEGSVNQIALHDFKIMKDLFDFDFTELAKIMRSTAWMHCFIMRVQATAESFFNKRIRDRICELTVKLESRRQMQVILRMLLQSSTENLVLES